MPEGLAMAGIKKLKVANPVVEMDGDEMTRVIWQEIREKLILKFLDLPIKYFDLSIQSRDDSDDAITVDAADAIKKYGVGIKCATITPDEARQKEFGLKKLWRSPNGTIRAILNGTIFREPIFLKSMPKSVPSWKKNIVIARHGFGDQYIASEMAIKEPGTLELVFTSDTGKVEKKIVHKFKKEGVALAMFNLKGSIEDFARCCFNEGLEKSLSVYLSTKNTILKTYDGLFKDTFQEIFDTEFKGKFDNSSLTYEHRLIDDMVAFSLKTEGGFVWAAKNYDGDVQSDLIAQAFGSLGLMTSELKTPDGKILESEAAHGTVTRHYRFHQKGQETSTNSVASIFAWTRGLRHRGKLDSNTELADFCTLVENAVVDLIEKDKKMTKDLALLTYGDKTTREHYLNTTQFIDAVAEKVEKLFKDKFCK